VALLIVAEIGVLLVAGVTVCRRTSPIGREGRRAEQRQQRHGTEYQPSVQRNLASHSERTPVVNKMRQRVLD
jgi:hypothetical protein